MKCLRCDAWTEVKATRHLNDRTVKRTRQCANGCPRFYTYEVMQSVWGSIKQPNARATSAAERRARLLKRNRRILAALKTKPGNEVARDFGLSPSSVSLIRKKHDRSAHTEPKV